MRFLFFGKKRSSEVKKAMEHIDIITHNLKNSFSRVKTDMGVIRDWLSYFKTKDKEFEDRFSSIETRLDEIGEVISYIHRETGQQKVQITPKKQPEIPKEPLYYEEEPENIHKMPPKNHLDHLTETQKAIFFRIGTFQRETGKDWVAIKTLAQDLYPGKSYDQVRSTISEYIGILMDLNLVEKMRKGKQTYIKITKKGQEFFKKMPKPKRKVRVKKK